MYCNTPPTDNAVQNLYPKAHISAHPRFHKSSDKFPIQKCIVFRKLKEISGIARRAYFCVLHKRFQTCYAQGVIDTEIAEKGHLWTETT